MGRDRGPLALWVAVTHAPPLAVACVLVRGYWVAARGARPALSGGRGAGEGLGPSSGVSLAKALAPALALPAPQSAGRGPEADTPMVQRVQPHLMGAEAS